MRNPEYHGRGFHRRNFFSLFFRGVGAALLAGGFIYGVVIFIFTVSATHTIGQVVKIETVQNTLPFVDKSNGSGTYYYPLIRFTAKSGKVVDFRASSGSQHVQYAIGDTVPVLYDPAEPQDGRIDTLWGVWGAPIILVGIGAIFLLIGFLAPMGFGNTPRRLSR